MTSFAFFKWDTLAVSTFKRRAPRSWLWWRDVSLQWWKNRPGWWFWTPDGDNRGDGSLRKLPQELGAHPPATAACCVPLHSMLSCFHAQQDAQSRRANTAAPPTVFSSSELLGLLWLLGVLKSGKRLCHLHPQPAHCLPPKCFTARLAEPTLENKTAQDSYFYGNNEAGNQ